MTDRFLFIPLISAGIYLLEVNNRNTRTRCEICLKLTINSVFSVNFEDISHLVLVFLLSILDKYLQSGIIWSGIILINYGQSHKQFRSICFLISCRFSTRPHFLNKPVMKIGETFWSAFWKHFVCGASLCASFMRLVYLLCQ